jgi:hypothetical protein
MRGKRWRVPPIRDVRFRDDQGMVSTTEMGLQKIMDGLNETTMSYDKRINVYMTKVMKILRNRCDQYICQRTKDRASQ